MRGWYGYLWSDNNKEMEELVMHKKEELIFRLFSHRATFAIIVAGIALSIFMAGVIVGSVYDKNIIVNSTVQGANTPKLKPIASRKWHDREYTHIDWKRPYYVYELKNEVDVRQANNDIKNNKLDTHAPGKKAKIGDLVYFSVDLNKFWLAYWHEGTAHNPFPIGE